MDEAGAKSITGVPVTAPQYTRKQVLAEVVIARSERILGGNTEVKAFVLSVHWYILGRKLFVCSAFRSLFSMT